MLIYKVTNTITGYVYVGQTTKTLEWRKRMHYRQLSKGKHSKLYDAMREYGVDNFVFTEICSATTKDELNALEKYYIAKYNCINAGYNKQVGGSNSLTYTLDAEARKHISEGMKKYRKTHPFTDSHRENLSHAMLGNHNFGTGDTRSIGCYCLLSDDGDTKHFHSYRDAYKWWRTINNPFNTDAECVYQRKIKQSIDKGYYTYGHSKTKYYYPKWFKYETGVVE